MSFRHRTILQPSIHCSTPRTKCCLVKHLFRTFNHPSTFIVERPTAHTPKVSKPTRAALPSIRWIQLTLSLLLDSFLTHTHSHITFPSLERPKVLRHASIASLAAAVPPWQTELNDGKEAGANPSFPIGNRDLKKTVAKAKSSFQRRRRRKCTMMVPVQMRGNVR